MKYASSIRYGGQLIDALDVDYSAYKHLGLLCPNCKEPVFLQAGSVRQLGDKRAQVPAHFKHFRCSDPALVKQCEARVATYDAKELERRASQSRNQRFKLLQKHFWGIICDEKSDVRSSGNFFKKVESARDVYPNNLVLAVVYESLIKDCVKYLIKNKDEVNNRIIPFAFDVINKINYKEGIDDLLQKGVIKQSMLGLKCSEGELDIAFEQIQKRCKHLSNSLNLKLHQMIIEEIVSFLLIKRNRKLLVKLLRFAIVYIPPQYYECEEDFIRAAIHNFVNHLVEIPWASEFAKRQEQEKNRLKSA